MDILMPCKKEKLDNQLVLLTHSSTKCCPSRTKPHPNPNPFQTSLSLLHCPTAPPYMLSHGQNLFFFYPKLSLPLATPPPNPTQNQPTDPTTNFTQHPLPLSLIHI
eukprot:3718059-Ditylum_brightwellii.AAC.1